MTDLAARQFSPGYEITAELHNDLGLTDREHADLHRRYLARPRLGD